MGSTGIEVWRPLLRSLRHTARAGAVKPTCSGVIANSQHGTFTWKGVQHSPSPLNAALGLPPVQFPDNEIQLQLTLDGGQIHCFINIRALNGRDILLCKESDLARLESLVGALRELAQWI